MNSAPRFTIPRRPFGKSAIELSIIGFGGILVMNAEQSHANRLVAEMVERGINYFDVAPSYGDAEARLGPALEPYRQKVFLACKTGQRTADKAGPELENSLRTMRTDHFDLYQLHAVTEVGRDIDAVFARGGAMEVIDAAKRDGRIRHVGFSAHSVDAALAAMDRYPFDSVLFPVNFACWLKCDWGRRIMEEAARRGVARLALKGMARQAWQEGDAARDAFSKCWYEPIQEMEWADIALRWTLSQPVTAALPPGEEKLFRMALDIAENYRPATGEEEQKLRLYAAQLQPIFQD